MRDTTTTYAIQLNHPPVAVIGSDSPRCQALVRGDGRLRIHEIVHGIDQLAGELADDAPHAFSCRLIEGDGIDVLLLLACDAF